MQKYNVSSLAKEMGVSADLLKLYEEHGLLAPHRDPQSRYRYYDIYDGGRVVSSMTLRNMGFSVRQTGTLLSSASLADLRTALEDRISGLREELSRLERLIPAVEEYAALLEDFSLPVVPTPCMRPGYYFLAQSTQEEFRQTERQKQLARRLLEELPYSERLLVIDRNSFTEGEEFRFQWGLAIREDRSEGWPVEEMRYFPPRPCLRLPELHSASCLVSREAFVPLARFLREDGRALEDDILCQVPVTSVEQGERTAYRMIFLPVALRAEENFAEDC